jgi:membrane-bound acyltransferase YfiQ involved in biofilm formation
MYFLSGLINFLFKRFDNIIILVSSLVINIIAMEMSFLFSDRIFLKYIFFYILGVYFTKESEKFLNFSRKYYRPVFIIFITSTFIYSIFYYYTRYGLMNYAWIVFSISGIFFLFELSIKLDKISYDSLKIRKLSKSTYYIYLIHPLILSGISRIFKLENFNTTLLLLIYFSVTLIISTALALGYTEIKNRYLKQRKIKKIC